MVLPVTATMLIHVGDEVASSLGARNEGNLRVLTKICILTMCWYVRVCVLTEDLDDRRVVDSSGWRVVV